MTFVLPYVNILVARNEVVKITSKKIGRPTDNPKIRRIQAKIDEDTSGILYAYCEQEIVSESEAIRRGIKKLADDLRETKK